MTGAMLTGEKEGVAGAGPEKEVEEVAVLEGRWSRIARTVCFHASAADGVYSVRC